MKKTSNFHSEGKTFGAGKNLDDAAKEGDESFPSRPADLELALRHCFLDQGCRSHTCEWSRRGRSALA